MGEVTYGDIVDVQMRCRFIKVQHRIEHIKVRISRLKALHVFTQAFSRYLRIWSADRCVFSRSYVNKMLVEALLLVRTCDNTLAGWTIEQVFKVITDPAVFSFLLSIVSLHSFIEKLVICFTQSLLNEHDVVGCSGAVYVPSSELSVVM